MPPVSMRRGANFARVTVNGEYLGIYSNVESIGKPFLKRRFGNNSGNLYEGTLADFYPKAIDRLEAKTNEKDHDRSKVMRLAELLAANGELDLDEVDKLVDIDNFIKFWAVESLIGFWDGYSNNQNNYWVYENRDNGKFYFMPWGADGSVHGSSRAVRVRPSGRHVGVRAKHAGQSSVPRPTAWPSVIARRCRRFSTASGKKTSWSNRSIASKPW